MADYCRDCRAGLEHCHGTLIHHPLRGPECTDDGCGGYAILHSLVLDCDAIGCRCTMLVAVAG